ncbi:hypothetical protein AS658_18510 [Serratia marcescens]|nr:hypothetical protein AM681_18520 [Serratia marcescens]AVU41608.1 hypothetical protein AS658_18510 [Serratia marcescens]OYO94489.1 hypothetical protein CHR63_20865 [Serratia marcescens]
MNQGSARLRHVLRVRSEGCALSMFKLPAPITSIIRGIPKGFRIAARRQAGESPGAYSGSGK